MADVQIFICHRQIDGIETAKWLHGHLDKASIELSPGNVARLVAYLDVVAPAIGDWHELHQPALERAQAFVFVASPGAYSRLGPEDWVHREVDWWVAHREIAPIIIDTTGQDDRWLPDSIKRRWPNSQRIAVRLAEWQHLSEPLREEHVRISIDRVLEGIRLSRTEVVFEDLKQERARVKKLRLSVRVTAFALTIAVLALTGLLWQRHLAHVRERVANHTLALLALEQAERALLTGDALGARALISNAVEYDRSAEVEDRASALALWATGDMRGATQRFAATLARAISDMETLGAKARPVDRLAASVTTRSLIETWLALTANSDEDAYPAVVALRALPLRLDGVLRSMCRLSQCGNGVLGRLQELEADVSRLAYMATTPSVSREKLWAEYQTDQRSLSELYREFGTAAQALELMPPGDITLDSKRLQQELRGGEVLVEFVLYHDRYVAWVVKRNGAPKRIELGLAAPIDESSKAFANAVSAREDYSEATPSRGLSLIDPRLHRPTEQLRDAGPKLRRLIWEPLEPYLGSESNKVYLVLDGSLVTVPFAALPGHRTGDVLLQERLLVYLSTSHDLLRRRFDRTALRNTLLIGDVSYGAPTFPPLPGTGREISSISALLQATGIQILRGTSASEDQFRRVAPTMSVVHLATHGWATVALPFDGARGLGMLHSSEPFTGMLDPLLLSGVAFAGIGQTSGNGMNDGVMSALEVRSLDLRRVQLVVLSACETVAMVKAGDSFIGMVRSFFDAGASTVVASTGRVDDSTAAELMIGFYRQLIGDAGSPAEALRAAALELRARGRKPFEWAGFVTYGF
jgi:CHAT domain-containing protein